MDTIKIVASDYVGFQVGSSIVKRELEYKDSPLKVTINSILYRLILNKMLPNSFLNFFNSIKDEYFREIIIDFVSLSVLNVITLNIIGEKKSLTKTVIKSAIQSVVSKSLHNMIK
jgi:hypothetical protein